MWLLPLGAGTLLIHFILAQPEGLFNILCSPVTLSQDPAGLCWDFYCFICFNYDDDDDD